MALFKCKMCGGTLEVTNESVLVCEYCGTKQTLPKLNDDKKAALYDRANHFRRNNEYDKAMALYEQVLNEDNEDSESYWSIVLCRYGIEYVEDPVSHKRIPTVNRAQYTSIFADVDYQNALKYADDYQKSIYEEEAKAIDDIQKGILAISSQEDPFDVFICYKETDFAGRRAPDSVYAQEIYNALNKEGYKVFFSRITLEDKLGTAYEPYIFSALNSAKVMIVVGTKPEHFNAVWVKNEWSRYLALIKAGQKKNLIPVYRDMSPYDLPEEFAYLQAQDMGKIGAVQDIVHGVEKLLKKEETKKVEVATAVNVVDDTTYMKRAFLYLEDGNVKSANEYCEKALEINPENAEAYLCLLMIELGVTKRNKLADCKEVFENKSNYEKAVRFASPQLKQEITGYAWTVKEKYSEEIYQNAVELSKSEEIVKLSEAVKVFESIKVWRNVDSEISDCKEKITSKQKAAAKAKKKKIISLVATVALIVCGVVGYVVYSTKIVPEQNYQKALEHYNKATAVQNGIYYSDAYKALNAMGDYKDAEIKTKEIKDLWLEFVISTVVYSETYFEEAGIDESQYEILYTSLLKKVEKQYNIQNFLYRSDLKKYVNCLKELPAGYKDRDNILNYLNLLYNEDSDYKGDQIKTLMKSPNVVEKVWTYDFVKNFLIDENYMEYFLVGEWTTSDNQYYITFYESENGGISCQYNLPWVSQPAGTMYYDIVDMTYIFIDGDGNELAKVYKFDVTGVNTMKVFCYKDNRTYTVTRK